MFSSLNILYYSLGTLGASVADGIQFSLKEIFFGIRHVTISLR